MCTCERVREDFGVKLHSPLYRGVAEGRGVTVTMISPRWGYCDVAPSEAECNPSEAECNPSEAEGDTKNAPHFCEALNHFVMSLS